MENTSRKVGALWEKISSTNKQYWSGELIINGTKHPIVAFNREKKHDKEPDIDILKSQEQEGLIIEE